jgi:hypothetical protein
MAFIQEGQENIQPQRGFWQMDKKELKAILENYVGNFETQINKHRSHKFLTDPAMYPTCGMGWLRDTGVLEWYLKEGWLSVRPDGFIKDRKGLNTKKRKWSWAVTMKYVEDRIDLMESALAELISRREFKQNEELKRQEELVKSMG